MGKKILVFILGVSFLGLAGGAGTLDSFNGNFFEGFESNNLSTNNWTISGTGVPWVITSVITPGPSSGIYYLTTGNTGGESIIETSLSTEDYVYISFLFSHTSDGNDAGEYLAADWYNGTNWTIFFYDETDYANVWQLANYSLPSQANNNPDFKIRFRALSGNPNEDFYIDDISIIGDSGPQINILYPQNNSIYNTASLFLRVNITGNSLDACWYELNGINNTFICGTEPTMDVSEGTNNLTVYVNNTLNILSKESISFNVNTSIPLTISIISPSNNTISTSATPRLKLLASDLAYSLINYTIYIYYENNTLYSLGNNGTLMTNVETEINLNPSLILTGNLTSYNIVVNATDEGGSNASVVIRYTLTLPAVTLVSPSDNHWDDDGNISFSFRVIDESYPDISCSLYLNDILNQTNNTVLSDNTLTIFDVNGISDGENKTWEIICIDASNNTGSDIRTFHVDTIFPQIQFVNSTTETGSYSQNFIQANVTATDNNLDTIIINLYNSTGLVNSTSSLVSSLFANFTNLSDGTYYLNVTANDMSGNINFTETRTIVLVSDTCTYSGSGNWEVDCSDNCTISSNVDLLGNNISIVGFGGFSTTANITNFTDLFISGDSESSRCEVYCSNGGCFA